MDDERPPRARPNPVAVQRRPMARSDGTRDTRPIVWVRTPLRLIRGGAELAAEDVLEPQPKDGAA